MPPWIMVISTISQFLFVTAGTIAVIKYKVERGEENFTSLEQKQQEQERFCNLCSTNMKVFTGTQSATNVVIKDSIQSVVNQLEKLFNRLVELEKQVVENTGEIKSIRERLE